MPTGSASKYCNPRCLNRANYLRNGEKIRESVRKYRTENKTEVNARQRQSRLDNLERARKMARKSYLKHREVRIVDALRYQARYPERVAVTRNKRRGAVTYSYLASDLNRMLWLYRSSCAYCKGKLVKFGREFPNSLQWDHVVPLARGGVNGIGNIVPSCRSCNLQKGTRLVAEWKKAGRWFEND